LIRNLLLLTTGPMRIRSAGRVFSQLLLSCTSQPGPLTPDERPPRGKQEVSSGKPKSLGTFHDALSHGGTEGTQRERMSQPRKMFSTAEDGPAALRGRRGAPFLDSLFARHSRLRRLHDDPRASLVFSHVLDFECIRHRSARLDCEAGALAMAQCF